MIQTEEGKIIWESEEAQSGESVFGRWMTQRDQHPFPQSDKYAPRCQMRQPESQHT